MANSINRRDVVTGLAATGAGFGLASCSGAVGSAKTNASGKPNIIFIMADDLGYADLSCYGRREYKTPNIDSLAEQGLRFTNGYANSAVCSATRTGLITGRYQYRFPIGLEEPLALAPVGLEPDVLTMPSELKKLGYETSLVGKWHLGMLPDYGPLRSGYDHFYGIRTGGVDYYTHESVGFKDFWDGDVPAEDVGYLTELLGDRAVEQIDTFSKTEAPFFLSLHFTSPHWPWEGSDEEGRSESARLDSSPGLVPILHYDGGNMETYAAMVKSLDDQVGRVLAALRQHGLEDDTIIVFTSDNGGERFSDNWPFTGQKSELLEGGIRVPMIVKWPGRVEAGSENDTPIMSMDWMPTFLAEAGYSQNEVDFDGVNLLPLFEGGQLAERPLFWRYKNHAQKAVRLGKWKYLKIAGNEFLFDVVADPLERGNLKQRFPEVFEDLKSRYEDWNTQMLPYTAANFSGGASGAQLADHYGVEKGILDAENMDELNQMLGESSIP